MTISRREFVKGVGAGILCAVVPKVPFAAPLPTKDRDRYSYQADINMDLEFYMRGYHNIIAPKNMSLRIFINDKEVYPTKDYKVVEQDNGTAYIVFERVNLEDFT